MSDLSINQIQTQLNQLFIGYGERKIIFWFDPKKEFEEEMKNKTFHLDNARIKIIEPHTQIVIKRFLELEDTDCSYLIYAPFERMKDDDENNHLLSILKYSTIFSADRISLVMRQLKIPSELHGTMDHYSKFFASKVRISSFEKVSTQTPKTTEEIEIVMMAVLTNSNTTQLSSVIQALFVELALKNDDLYSQLENFDLTSVFWKYVMKYYGYFSEEESIQSLSIAFFVNYFYVQLGHLEVPKSLKSYEILGQTTAIESFMDNMMNDSRYIQSFDELSAETYRIIGGDKLLNKLPISILVNADIFESVHKRILNYYSEQLLAGDYTPSLNGISLQETVTKRMQFHFGMKYINHYRAILSAQELLSFEVPMASDQFSERVKEYENESYLVDSYYRDFIWNMDRIESQNEILFTDLRNLVEKKYKLFLNNVCYLWNELLNFDERPSMLDFYDKFAKNNIKTVVIISDALRYEAVKEIQESFKMEKKYRTKLETIFTVLPSVTEFGKAALLHSKGETYQYLDGTDVRVSGIKTSGTSNRDKILKKRNRNALAITYDEVISKGNAKELRELFNGQDIIYLYHDQIDKTGDHGQESEVFNAVQRTIDDLKALLPRISNGANVYRFIITSDHGFIYTRSKIEEYEKIETPSTDVNDRFERRFIISKNHYNEIGVKSLKLGTVLRNSDERFIHFPETAAIFKKAGGGQNYFHGGSSPQEMIVPVLEVNVSRGSAIKAPVQIQLMTTKRKIIGLSISLEFYQTDAVSDSVAESRFLLYFEDKSGNIISKEHLYYATSVSVSAAERVTVLNFDFINRNYDSNEKIYLIIKNINTQVEEKNIEFLMDSPFSGDFNFDI